MAAGGSSRGLFHEMTQDEYKKLVQSTDQFRESVVRIIKANEEQEVVGTGTAFCVYSGDNKSLFLTCDHNFSEVKSGEVIRLYDGKKNYKVAEILRRSPDHDLLLFSVMSVPKCKCLQFSTEQLKEEDQVVVLGYTSPSLPVKGKLVELVLVKTPASLAGTIIAEPLQDTANGNHEKILTTCESTKGVSGSPLFKNDKVVGVLLGVDKQWREAVSANTVLQVLRGWHNLGNGNETFEELFKIAHDTFQPCA